MQTYYSLDEYTPTAPMALTQGTFDGLHRGHKKILEQLREEAERKNLQTAVLTFFPHPRMVIRRDQQPIKLLDTIQEKIRHFETQQIDHLFILPFTDEFAETKPEDYIHNILEKKLGVKLLVVGYDHRFGKDRAGDISLLKNKKITSFDVMEIGVQLLDEIAISSTKIRRSLNEGNIGLANQYLGYPYNISGTVVHGHNAGSKIGFPTANIHVSEDYKLIPADGVYAIRVLVENKLLDGVANIGNQPTFEGRKHAIEVHIFSFSDDIYDKNVSVYFADRIRGEKKFDDIESLIRQIKEDVERAKFILAGL